jgi:hypothetical protein
MIFQVSTDVGAFEQVIQALHRLMDLKEKYLDVEVCLMRTNRSGCTCPHPSFPLLRFNTFFQILDILVRSVISGREDNKGLPGKYSNTRRMYHHSYTFLHTNPL